MWRCPRRVSTVVCVHEPHCRPPNCSGHGTCVDGHCECTGHFWRGDACSELDCGPSNCSQHGLCTESEWGAHRRVECWRDPSSPRPGSCLCPHLASMVLLWQLAVVVMLGGQDPTAVKVRAASGLQTLLEGVTRLQLLRCRRPSFWLGSYLQSFSFLM